MARMKLSAYLAAGVLLAGLLSSGNARAMAIFDFAKMNTDDEATYITSLVVGSAKMLRAQGHPDQARKVIAFFKDPSKNGGLNQFALQLKELHEINDRNAINPNNRAYAYQVEDAMELTLKDNGFIVPASYLLQVNKDFRPVGPLRGRGQ